MTPYKKFLKILLRVKPLFIQIFTAGFISMVSMCVSFVVFIIIDFGVDDIFYRLESADGILCGQIFIEVPICTTTLLLIHLFKVYPFILYNKKLVMMESIIFSCTLEIAIKLIEGIYFKTCLLLSIISIWYFAFFIKKLFPRPYQNFQNKIEHEYSELSVDKRIDIMMSLIFTLLCVTPTLIFIFIFF